MAIPDHARTNFDTLLRAACDGNLALMECLDAATREPRYVLCALGRSDGEYVLTPFGHLADGNSYDAYRVELTGFTNGMRDWLRSIGLFSEMINWTLRFFVPVTDEGAEILSKLVERHRLIDVARRS